MLRTGDANAARAELADQINAELAAIKARMEHLVKVHVAEIDRLTRWRESLDIPGWLRCRR